MSFKQFVALSLLTFVAGNSSNAADEPKTHVLVPGFKVQTLPLTLTNVNGLDFGPDGKLYALGYDGRIHKLADTNGDGLEDRAEPYWDKEPFISPIAMRWHDGALYVSSMQKISRLTDTDGDGKADREEVVATGWPKVPTGSNLIDVMGFAFDREGNLFLGIGCADFTNAYLIRDGKAHYRTTDETGTILKVDAKTGKRAIYATGMRFNYALDFNRAGDLFATDQEGETWLPGGNVLDELNWVRPGKHYGWPPRHEQHLPNVIDEPPVAAFSPQHASACGLVFNEPGKHGGWDFGPFDWSDDAFVALYSRGRIARVRLVKTEAGYVGKVIPFATIDRMPADLTISFKGALYVAVHSGQPDWGTGPQGEGHILKITEDNSDAPKPIAAWATGPLDVRVAFDKPIDAGVASHLVGSKVTFGAFVRAGDRFEAFKPPYKAVEAQLAAPRGTIAIASASLEDEGKTLALTTDPQPWDATYALALPGIRRAGGGSASDVDIAFDHSGVDVAWESQDGSKKDTAWLPHPNLDVSERLVGKASPFERLMPHLSSPGTLILRTRLRGPRDQISLTVNTGGPLGLDEVTFEGEPGKVSDNRTSATLSGTIEDQPATIELVLRTGENSDKPATLTVTYHAGSDPTERPLRLEQLVLPWAPAPPPMPSTASVTPPQLAGGDATRGAAVFASDEAKCATCHMFRGHGKAVGPDLSNLHERDVASIFRDIAEPSATINPDYVPYTVAVKDGRVLSGIVKAEGADAIRVTDTNAQSTVVKRAEIEELRPTNTSIMPVGLAGAIGEQKLRDLVSYLTSPPEPKK